MKATEDVTRVVAGLSWLLLGAGLIWLVSAAAPDSGYAWDSVRQSTNAWIGIGLVTAAVPAGVAALVLDRPRRRRARVPGETRAGIRHPTALAAALAVAAVVAVALAVLVARAPLT